MGINASMFFRVPTEAREIARRWGWDIAERFGRDSWLPIGDLPVRAEFPEGDGIFEGVFEVDLAGDRYYGHSYERGPIQHHINIAELLEDLARRDRVPIEIRYGGDATWDDAEPFTDERRRALRMHWVENGHRPYLHGDGGLTTCHACTAGPIYKTGGSHSIDTGHCPGCATQFTRSRTGGEWIQRLARVGERQEEEAQRVFEAVANMFKRDPSRAVEFLRGLGDELDGVPGVPPGVLDALKSA